MLECTIDFNVNDRPSSVRAFIQRLGPIWSASSSEPVKIDLAKCQYLGPDAAAILGATVLRAREWSQPLSVILPSEPPEVNAFCEYSGLNEWIFRKPPPDITHPHCVTVPLRSLDHARHNDVEAIFRLIRAYTELSEPVQDALGIAFTEVVQNVEDHARSPVGAVTCARYDKISRNPCGDR